MARPPLPIGTWGKIRTYPTHRDRNGKPDRFRATARFRDFDGRTKTVEASGKSATTAANNLREKLRERSAAGRDGELTAVTRFSVAADLWMTRFAVKVDEGARSAGSMGTYRRQLDNHVLPALGEVRLGEVTTSLVDKVIAAIKAETGAPTARTCRSVISGVMSLAVRYGAVTANPVREVDRIEVDRKRVPRALTSDERTGWLEQLQADEKAVRRDLPDLSLFLLGSGVRIGEALAVLWSQVDLDEGLVEITHTIIRVKGEGLVRKPAKSRAGERLLELPLTVVAMLRRRAAKGIRLDAPVFPDSLGGFRDPSNVQRAFREARGDGHMMWVTSHSFRKTVATVLDDAQQSGRQVADQLGHAKPSMTQDVYMGRKVRNPQAAVALEAALRVDSEAEKCG